MKNVAKLAVDLVANAAAETAPGERHGRECSVGANRSRGRLIAPLAERFASITHALLRHARRTRHRGLVVMVISILQLRGGWVEQWSLRGLWRALRETSTGVSRKRLREFESPFPVS
jgi:hypothetical protein